MDNYKRYSIDDTILNDPVRKVSFNLKGVTHFNRQDNLKLFYEKHLPKEEKILTLEKYTDNTVETFCIKYNGLEIGTIPKEQLALFLSPSYDYNLDNIHIDKFTNEYGKEIYWAKMYVIFTPKPLPKLPPPEPTRPITDTTTSDKLKSNNSKNEISIIKRNLPFTLICIIALLPFVYLFISSLGWWCIIFVILSFAIIFIAADLIRVALNELFLASPVFIAALFVGHNLMAGNHWNNNAWLICAPFGILSIISYIHINTRPWLMVVLSGSVWFVVAPLYFLVPISETSLLFGRSVFSVLLFFYALMIWALLATNWLLSHYKKDYIQ